MKIAPYTYQITASALFLFTIISGCTSVTAPSNVTISPSGESSSEKNLKPLVVATTNVICDLAKEVAQKTIDLKCLVGAGSDPHVYQPTPDDRKAIENASLVLYGGYDFEPTLIKIIQATTSKAPKVAVYEAAVPKPLQGEHEHEHGENHSPGEKKNSDGHADKNESEQDPHVWHNAQNGIKIVEVIQASLAQSVPTQADGYSKNAKALTTKISQLDTWIKTQISTIPPKARKLVTTHDALGYYADAYGIPVEGALQGLSTDEKPTPARIKKLVDEIRKIGVPTIFAEATANSKLLAQVAKDANVKLSPQPLFADGLGELGSAGDSYQKMMIANTQAIVEGLGGKYEPFAAK